LRPLIAEKIPDFVLKSAGQAGARESKEFAAFASVVERDLR
jgi:hypothetical protein